MATSCPRGIAAGQQQDPPLPYTGAIKTVLAER
jgi:hypothetical protein